MRSLVWFRRDLRVSDNTALHHGCEMADDGVIGLYVITPEQWQAHDDAGCKVKFWLDNLRGLSAILSLLNIPLLIRACGTFSEVPELVCSVAMENQCDSVFINQEYEVNEFRRDQATAATCNAAGIQFETYHDRVIVPPDEIKTKDGRFYSVFTPYRRVWDTRALEFAKVLPAPSKQKTTDVEPSPFPESIDGFSFDDFREDLWQAGEAEAASRLERFSTAIADYNDGRDIPSINGTSLLSPYLAAGVVSPRQCLAAALAVNNGKIAGADGPTTWISELTWRDFYTAVMVGFPRVSMHRPFKVKTDDLDWRDSSADLEAWKSGRTGYPIVDAGMRQLNQTGWMHNRLRMVTAMFLTKNLLIDWRLGEQYFMQKLIDGDLAANNGGWQWSASTGTDAVPYFRIFNPFSQSKRFDPDGQFIKKLCPELKPVPSKSLHDPGKLKAAVEKHGVDYPSFVVNYKEGRERALAAFKSL
ncbi:MAG: deoxyribodipyrimidine photo-lyase [Planctomycetota bacterium]